MIKFTSLIRVDKETGNIISEPFINIFGIRMYKIGKGSQWNKDSVIKYYWRDFLSLFKI